MFDPISAMKSDWLEFFSDIENLTKDFKDRHDGGNLDATPCSRAFEQVAGSDLPLANRMSQLVAIVSAIVDSWDDTHEARGMTALFRGRRHPVQDIMTLTCINGEEHERLVSVAVRLWDALPDEESLFLMSALGKYIPLDFGELQELFHTNCSTYGKTVIRIMLDRANDMVKAGGDKVDSGKRLICAANYLFETRMSEVFGDVDPLALDWLIAKGLRVAVAEKWLNQSINRTNADAGDKVAQRHCDSAINRWVEIAASRMVSA